MDPKEALRELRELYRAVLADETDIDSPAYKLAEKIDEVDDWMSRGGFSPWPTFIYAEGRGHARPL